MSDSKPVEPPISTPPQRAFGRTYWMLNTIEMFERLAYYGIRSVVPLYIMQATEPGGLHLTALDKGWIYMWWAILQSWLPMFTGGIADRYGYKRVLFFAICTNSIGYLMMALFHSYEGFFAGILVLATGTAFFKPALQGSIAQSLTKQNSSLGWGLFYWVVNIGAVMAPLLATVILGTPHSAEGWRNLFIASSVYTAFNLLMLFTFKDVASGSDKSIGLVRVFVGTVQNIWPFWFVGGKLHRFRSPVGTLLALFGLYTLVLNSDQWQLGLVCLFIGCCLVTWLANGRFTWQLRLPAFLLIMSCFWMMMYQLWDLHPNFIADWIDSSMVASYAPAGWLDYSDRGLISVQPQILLNLNAALIVALVVPISWLVRKMRTLSAMLIGMSVATAGVAVAGLTDNGWVLLLGVTFFSLGEMLTGPKKNEYLGLIAPAGKKGLYLGYVNIPIGIGVGFGSMIAGVVYDRYGEKASLALDHLAANPQLVARAARSVDWSDSLDLLPPLLEIDRADALSEAAEALGQSAEQAAKTLQSTFRFDQGQLTNLGLQFLALHDQNRAKVESALVKSDLSTANVGRLVAELPEALGLDRFEVWERVRRIASEDTPGDAPSDSALADTLWDRFGNQPETLNNLALEFLAQATDRLAGAVPAMNEDNPKEFLTMQLGIGRTKSFTALSFALGAGEEAVNDALAAGDGSSEDEAYVYLISKRHRRFLAVARKDWSHDVALLREMIEGDAGALKIASEGLYGSLTSAEGGIDYHVLAGKQALIRQVLDAKDWSRTPRHAAQILRLNPFEARAMVASEISQSAVTATKILWDRYHPQYHVWIPFAAIGVLATIALAIFGQMAKRWSDMNA